MDVARSKPTDLTVIVGHEEEYFILDASLVCSKSRAIAKTREEHPGMDVSYSVPITTLCKQEKFLTASTDNPRRSQACHLPSLPGLLT